MEFLLSQQIWSALHLAAFLADPGIKQGSKSAGQGDAIWSGRECAIPPARQGSEPQKTVLNVNTWSWGSRPQGSVLGQWKKLILFSKWLSFFISCYGIMADFTFLEKLEHSTGFLSSSLATHV